MLYIVDTCTRLCQHISTTWLTSAKASTTRPTARVMWNVVSGCHKSIRCQLVKERSCFKYLSLLRVLTVLLSSNHNGKEAWRYQMTSHENNSETKDATDQFAPEKYERDVHGWNNTLDHAGSIIAHNLG